MEAWKRKNYFFKKKYGCENRLYYKLNNCFIKRV